MQVLNEKLTGVEEGRLWRLRRVPQHGGRCPNPSQAGLASVWGEIPAQLGQSTQCLRSHALGHCPKRLTLSSMLPKLLGCRVGARVGR